MIKIQIDNKKVEVPANTTVLKACEIIGIEISRFCYHEKLSIAGNCRMCLVEIEKSPKPVVSCSMPVMPGMQIFTGTPLVKKARENILEFLLLNHPLDCPVCDQGGECDLQDQALLFGSDRSRFYELKRGVEDKKLGGLIKTIMTRCIHCTRCVRFSIEVAGIPVLGTTLRGTSTEIGTYLEKKFTSELSGNVIDLCPVGALTSKPYAFISRPWELKTEDTIDIFDGVGSNIRVDFKEYKIVRVIPRLQEEINGEWISNKTRFFYDGLTSQRIRFPEIYKDKKWMRVGWGKAFLEICTHLQNQKPAEIAGICSANSDLETQVSFKNLINSFGSENVGFNKNLNLDTVVINNFKPHSTFSDLDKSDWCLLIGLNPRFEASVLNARLRKRYLEGNFTLGYIGFNTNFTYPIEHLGVNITSLRTLKVKNFLNKLKSKQNPLIIIGSNVYKRKDANQIQVYLNFLILKYKKI
jgi:NADH-quinone oxidoreductase chain G